MTQNLAAGFPSAPVVDPATGTITPAWRGFLTTLYSRTGGASGVTVPAANTAVAAEAAARAAADQVNAAALAAEVAKRKSEDVSLADAIAAEAGARGYVGNSGANALTAETARAEAAEAALAAAIAAASVAHGRVLPLVTGDLPAGLLTAPDGQTIGVPV